MNQTKPQEQTPLARMTACIPTLTEAGCPPPLAQISVETESVLVCIKHKNRGTSRWYGKSPDAVAAVLRDWVMGVVVPWVYGKHRYECYVYREWSFDAVQWRIQEGYEMLDTGIERSYVLAVAALLEAICGVVGGEEGDGDD